MAVERTLVFNKPEMLGSRPTSSTLKMARVGTALLQGHKALAGFWRVSSHKGNICKSQVTLISTNDAPNMSPLNAGVHTHACVQTHVPSTYRMPRMLEPKRRLFSTHRNDLAQKESVPNIILKAKPQKFSGNQWLPREDQDGFVVWTDTAASE